MCKIFVYVSTMKEQRLGNSSCNEYNVANANEYKNKQKGSWYI